MEAPRTSHWDVVIRIIHKKFSRRSTLYRKNGHLSIEGFTHIDWQDPLLDLLLGNEHS
jgi:hypothetical protein